MNESEKIDPRELSPLALAFVGDSVLELLVRQRLAEHIARFRQGLAALPFHSPDSQSAIQPVIVGENARALALAQALRQRGMWVTAIRPPTVPPGTARLRLTLTAAHEAQDIETLLEALHDAGE